MLNEGNYFSKENQLKYMGASQFKSFMECEAATIAELNGEYEREKTPALLFGSYVDAWFEGSLDKFKIENPELFASKGKSKGELKSEFRHADYIIERIKRDELFMKYMSGEKQVIKTGEIAGVPFKIKMDSYHPNKCIVDLKVMKDFELIWNEEKHTKEHFIDAWGYGLQAAIYTEIEGNNLPFFIVAATKEKEPDMCIYYIPEEVIAENILKVEEMAKYFNDLKYGIGTPQRCEKCDYCKRTKKLTEIIDYRGN